MHANAFVLCFRISFYLCYSCHVITLLTSAMLSFLSTLESASSQACANEAVNKAEAAVLSCDQSTDLVICLPENVVADLFKMSDQQLTDYEQKMHELIQAFGVNCTISFKANRKPTIDQALQKCQDDAVSEANSGGLSCEISTNFVLCLQVSGVIDLNTMTDEQITNAQAGINYL